MMYFDTSALAKKYVRESGSDEVCRLLKEGEEIATSELAYPELVSALVRRSKGGDISKGDLETLLGFFETDWTGIITIRFQTDMLKTIKRLILQHGLKGADSIHLGSAIWLREQIGGDVTFVASDSFLLEAARAENLHVVDPGE